MRRIVAIALFLSAGVWAADCGNATFQVGGPESYWDFYQRLDRKNCEKEWLIVIYMAADNNLSPYSFRDLWEMEAVGSSASVDTVVFHDGEKKDGLRYYHMAKDPKRVNYSKALEAFVQREKLEDYTPQQQEEVFLTSEGSSLVRSPVVNLLPEGDSGSIKTAAEFMHWVLSRYPSRRLMLIGWSHGDGFDAKRLGAFFTPGFVGRQGGFAFDTTSKSHMAVTEMAAGVKKLNEKHRKGMEIDIAGSDACLNQQVEFGYEWKGVAKYVFGSSSIVQKKGFNYKILLDWFSKNSSEETFRLATKIPEVYGASVSREIPSHYSSYFDPAATMATWTVSELIFLKDAMEDLGQTLTHWLEESDDELEKIKRLQELRQVIEKGLRFGNVSYDLHAFLLSLNVWAREHHEDWLRSINRTEDALNQSVLSRFIGDKYQNGLLKTSKGVAIWLPSSKNEFQVMFPKFQKSQFYQIDDGLSQWAKFVEILGTAF